MLGNIWKTLAFCSLVLVAFTACDSGQPPAPVVQPAPVAPAPVPPPAPVAQPVAPPPTPLLPIAEEEVAKPSEPRPKVKPEVEDDIDKPLPGKKTEGDELLGNYTCKLDAEDLPTGPFQLPGFGCRIFRADDGKLRVGPASKGIASLKGEIQDPKESGYFVVGNYKFPGNKLRIKARMTGNGKTYKGKGRGVLNQNKDTKIKYKLTMTKK